MKLRLAEHQTQLRATGALWLRECADAIGCVMRGIDRDDAFDVSEQMTRIADTLSAYAEGASNAMGICCSCLDAEWSQASQRVALARGIAVSLRGMSQRMGRAA